MKRFRLRFGWILAVISLVAAAIAAAVWLAGRPGAGRGEPVPDGAPAPAVSRPSWKDLDNASGDGWSSEALSSRAEGQLKRLGEMVLAAELPPAGELEAICLPEVVFETLVPAGLQKVFDDGVLRIDRAATRAAGAPSGSPLQSTSGGQVIGGARAALQELREFVHGAVDTRFKFKIFNFRGDGERFTTRQYFSLCGRDGSGRRELNAVWTCRWTGSGGGLPRLERVEAEEYEQATVSGGGKPLFTDCTEALFSGAAGHVSQLSRGFGYWLERIQDNRYFELFGAPGLAVGDADNDGLEDLYVCQEGGLPNLLFLQKADGTLQDASAGSGVDFLESSRSALLVDLDNDGDRDLAVAITGSLVLCVNETAASGSAARFRIGALLPTSEDSMSISAADYDRDGDLDLYVCAYNRDDLLETTGAISIGGAAAGFVYHDANTGAPNSLFRNDTRSPNELRFADATLETGLDANNRRYSFASSWEDADNDGDPDLYVANDFGRNNLYRNDTPPGATGRFTDIAGASSADDAASGMSVSWGDYNRDGRMDLYIGNMFSSAGGRITGQDLFKPESPEIRAKLQRFARGNTLLRNNGARDGGISFTDVSEAAGVTVGRWAWSSNFVDINNDGWEDLVVANGYITTDDSSDL